MEQDNAADFNYWAFISYSHIDKEWGDWLHRSLETYRVPRRLIGRSSRDGVVPRRAFPVFRDREELPGSANLGDNITAALTASRYLIVICSPQAAVSHWVNEEIKTFKAMGREDRILCLITAGEPNATAKPELGLLECFPEAVRFRVDRNRQITNEPAEPIAADARKDKDGKTNAKLKLLAGVLGVAYDELKQRDKQRRRRRRVQIVAGAFLFVAILAGTFVWKERQRRVEQRRATAQREFANALPLLQQNEAVAAVAWLARAIRDDPDNAAARTRLVSVLTQRNWASPIGSMLTHKGAVVAAEFSPDGKRIATASEDGSVRVWNTETGKALTDPIPHPRVNMVTFSPDGTRLLSAGQPDARILDATTGKQIGPGLKHKRPLETALFSPDGSAILTASVDGTAAIWNATNGELRVRLPHAAPVLFAAWSSDGKRVATASLDETARVWDATTGLPVAAASKIKSIPYALEFSPDGLRFLTASEFVAQIWDASTGQLVFTIQNQGSVGTAHFSPDGKSILTASFDKTVRQWDAATGAEIGHALPHKEAVHLAVFNGDGTRIVTGTREGTVQLWDAKTGRALSEPIRHGSDILALGFNRDGTRIVTASKDGTAQVWDAIPGAAQPMAVTASDTIADAWFEPDGNRMTTLTMKGSQQTWENSSGRLLSTNKASDGNRPILSGDGKLRAVIDDGRMKVTAISLTNSQPAGPGIEQKMPVLTAALDRSGQRLAIADVASTVRCYDVATGRVLVDGIKHAELVRSISFSPDGLIIATGSMDHLARLWDARTGAAFSQPFQHGDVVEEVRFSADGKLLATASWDHNARVWGVATGQVLLEPFAHDEAAVRAAKLSADNRRLVTAAGNRAFIWDLPLLTGTTRPELASLAESIGGFRIDEKGLLVPTNNRADSLGELRRKFAVQPVEPFAQWGTWLLGDRDQRTISPFASAMAPPHAPLARVIPPAAPTPPVPATPDSREEMLSRAWLQHAQFAFGQMKDPPATIADAEEALRLVAQLAPSRANDPKLRDDQLAAFEFIAYARLFTRQPAEAIEAAKKGLQINPGDTWLKGDLCAGYLLTGQVDPAREILRENKDAKLKDTSFAGAVLKTLDELKARGTEVPESARAIVQPAP